MKLTELFESAGNIVYHATNLEVIANILSSNSLNADTQHIESLVNPGSKSNKMISGVSLTRDKIFAEEWADVILVLDLTKLKQNYKIKSVAYFDGGDKINREESEEFVIGTIKNLDRYLVSIYFPKRLEQKYTNFKWVKKNIAHVPVEYAGWQAVLNSPKYTGASMQNAQAVKESKLTESKSANLYHSTNCDNALNILMRNTLADKTIQWLGDKKIRGSSFTRNFIKAKNWLGYGDNVIFVIDQQKLAYNHKIIPIDYFATHKGMAGIPSRGTSKNESEEFVIGPIKNFDNYIKAIVINEYCAGYLKEIIDEEGQTAFKKLLNHPKLKIISDNTVRFNEGYDMGQQPFWYNSKTGEFNYFSRDKIHTNEIKNNPEKYGFDNSIKSQGNATIAMLAFEKGFIRGELVSSYGIPGLIVQALDSQLKAVRSMTAKLLKTEDIQDCYIELEQTNATNVIDSNNTKRYQLDINQLNTFVKAGKLVKSNITEALSIKRKGQQFDYTIYDDKKPVALTTLWTSDYAKKKDSVEIAYFGVNKNFRNQGYGLKGLQYIKQSIPKLFPGTKYVIAEPMSKIMFKLNIKVFGDPIHCSDDFDEYTPEEAIPRLPTTTTEDENGQIEGGYRMYCVFALNSHITEIGRIIPGANTPPGITADHTQKMALALGFKVNKDGYPPLLLSSGKINTLVPKEIDHAEDDKKSMFGHNYDLTKFTNGKSSDMIKLRESIKLLEFNVVNQQEVDAYLDKIAAKTNIPEVKNWIKKNIRTYIINNQQLNQPTKVVIDTNTPIWVRDAVNRGDALYKFAPNNEFTGKLEHILDWLKSEQAKEYINKLQKVTFDQAVDLSDRWTQTLIKKASSKEDEAGIKDIMQLPNGYKIVQIISAQALDREGKLMQHCVGSYANEVAEGSTIIYSLRDSKNEPHCTIEVKKNTVEQIKGKQNEAVVEKYIQYVKLFLDKIKLKVNPNELTNVGLIKINGKILELKEINEFTEQEQIDVVRYNGNLIEFIKNPSLAVQLAAVEQYGGAIEYIKNPSEKVQLAAIKNYSYAIQYIKNPSEEVQLAAVKQNGLAIKYIKNPSEAVQIAAVKRYGGTIQYIKNPSEAVQLAAVEREPEAIQYIENPTPKVLAYVKSLKK